MMSRQVADGHVPRRADHQRDQHAQAGQAEQRHRDRVPGRPGVRQQVPGQRADRLAT